jgi:isocitrate dehydrogenase
MNAARLSCPSGKTRAETDGNFKLALIARESGGELYLFAVNYDERAKPAQATIRVASLPAGASITVVDENRTIKATQGAFTDAFEPLAVHIYRVAQP